MPIEQLAAIEVDLTWVAGRMEHRIVFGKSLAEHVTEPHRKTVTFAHASIFAVMRWAASDLGLTVARLEVMRGTATPSWGTRVPFVRPAVDLLMRVSGWSDVQRGIRLIDAIQDRQNRSHRRRAGILAACRQSARGRRAARGSTPGRHMAWQLRQRISP